MGDTDTAQPKLKAKPVVFNIMLATGLGGIEQAALDYHQLLQKAGYQPISIIQPLAEMKHFFDKNELPYHILRNWGMHDLFSWLRLAALIRKHRPVYIITHGSRAAYIAHKAIKKVLPLIPSLPGTRIPHPPIIAVAHNYKYRRLLTSDRIITVTKDIQDSIIRDGYPGERTTSIPNTAEIAPAAELAKREKRLIMPYLTFAVGAIGRLEEEKGFDLLIQAVAEVRAMGHKCILLLAGSGSQEEALKKLAHKLGIKEYVKFFGWVRESNKKDFLSLCDVLAIPSRRETFSIALLEAFAHKLPVVVSQTQGPLQIATHEINAELFPIDDIQALAASIVRIAEDTAYRLKIAENGYNLFRAEYTTKAVTKKLAKFLSNLPA